MKSSAEPRSLQGRKLALTAIILGVFAAVSLTGCPAAPLGGGGDGNQDEPPTDPIRAEIISPSTGFGMSALDPPVSVRYNVDESATDVRGFRVPVVDGNPDSASIGDRVIIAPNLGVGADQFFSFDPGLAGVGFFRVGIEFTLNGVADDAESQAVIQVLGSPAPVFIQPPQTLAQVTQGTEVFISFDCQDPEGIVQWRLFYLRADDTADALGTVLATGSGNVGTSTLETAALAPGDYQIGLSATDSGQSVAGTANSDEIVTVLTHVITVVEAGQANPPTIAVATPATDTSVYRDAPFTIFFSGKINDPEATRGTIVVFYDNNDDEDDGFVPIKTCSNAIATPCAIDLDCPGGRCRAELPVSATNVLFPTGLAEGTYFIGATINDGINPSKTDYAEGELSVVRTVTLDVTAPASSLSVAPGANVDVKWTTNAPAGSGTVDVFYQTVDASGVPFGAEIVIFNHEVITTKTAPFSSPTPGVFEITVRLNLNDGTTKQDAAPQHVRVTSLPAVLWLGSLAKADSGVEGAIFGGVNFEDNAGSAFAKVDDLDGDGLDEFVIAARYGKPFFVNPNGIGIGEAYLIYGERGTKPLKGEYNLNSVGSSTLRGVTLTGIRTIDNSGVTEGLSDVLSIPDADGDGKGELAFGFPKVESRNLGHTNPTDLDRPNQFLGGGVVIVSSENSILGDPTSGSPVINLDLVGQQFTNLDITPSDRNLVLLDRFKFKPGTPPDPGNNDPGTDPTCELGTDSIVDTVLGPNVGFVDFDYAPCNQIGFCRGIDRISTWIGLARGQAWDHFVDGRDFFNLFSPIASPPAPADEICETQTLPVASRCEELGIFFGLNSGSGFYPATSTPTEPKGARIVGREDDDRFGTTMTLNEKSSADGSAELIFSAPARNAKPEEVVGVTGTVNGSGITYITRNRMFWGEDSVVPGVPPKPHQYIMNRASHCSEDPDIRAQPIWFNTELGPVRDNDPNAGAVKIAGDAGDRIQDILGINDFNGDGRNDLAIGAPRANGGNGRVYVVYRRQAGSLGLEGDFLLSKLALSPQDPQRLDGLLISNTTLDGLGSSLAGGIDFNGDGVSDLVIGSPNAGDGTGEVIIVFGGTGIVSPANGVTVNTLLSTLRTASGGPAAVRIRGNPLDTDDLGIPNGQFGFNIANAGDMDGDGLDDLLVAAPNATPRFDPTPNDATDEMTTPGLDLNFDGVRDNVPGSDDLLKAGLVYVIFGSNRLDQFKTCKDTDKACSSNADCPPDAVCGSTNFTININQLGKPQLHGLMIAGRRTADRIGGGDAGDSGIDGKLGRSRGLAGAGDVDGDNRADILIGAILADPRRDPITDVGILNAGETYYIPGSSIP